MTTLTINDILEKFDQITNDGDGWLVCCPVHGDTNPSLRISLTDGGKVLMNCRSQDCCFADIVAAVGLTTADFSNVQTNGERTIGAAGTKVPATALDVAKLSELVDHLALSFRGSPSSDYAWDRWGIDEDMAKDLKLGHLHPVDEHPLMQRQFARVQAVAIPLLDFDGQPKGMQRRSLFDDADRWSTLMNPATDRSWSRLGVMLHDHADDYILLTEGPGDALSAYGAGQSAVCLRGSSTMVKKSIDEIIDRLGQKMVVLAGDADQAGQLFNKNAGALLKAANIDVRVLQLPSGAGDLTEWREESGGLFAQQLLRAIRSAVPFLDEQHPDAPIQSSEESYAFTDKGNGQRLVKWLGDNFINTQELGHLMYADGRWAPDTKNNLPMA